MKKIILSMILVLCCQFVFSQVNPVPGGKRITAIEPGENIQVRIIPAPRASLIRKDVMQLKLQLNQLIDLIAATKKDIDNAEEGIKNTLDSMSEMGETESLRLQMAMDRLSKMMSTLSNLLKKISDTDAGITQNIK